jgi:hypothetical protein
MGIGPGVGGMEFRIGNSELRIDQSGVDSRQAHAEMTVDGGGFPLTTAGMTVLGCGNDGGREVDSR